MALGCVAVITFLRKAASTVCGPRIVTAVSRAELHPGVDFALLQREWGLGFRVQSGSKPRA